jgi:Cu-Zn family superoxide dismutase
MNQAVAYVFGGTSAPNVNGIVRFSDDKDNLTRVDIDIRGLPDNVHGFHVHEKGDCAEGNPDDPFNDTGAHFNPQNKLHPFHAGDMPALIPSNGRAKMVFYTGRFNVSEVIGRSVVIHADPDDYRTQPAGNSGKKIACGIIRRVIIGKNFYDE